MHVVSLEIDSIVLSNLKTPIKEYPNLVLPHPEYEAKCNEPVLNKKTILFEEWHNNYKVL